MTKTVYRGLLQIPAAELQELERRLCEPDANCRRDEPLFDREVVFPDGCRMAIQVIASTLPAEESAWSQAVLFTETGNEVCCSDVGETLAGEWTLSFDEVDYRVDVEPLPAEATPV